MDSDSRARNHILAASRPLPPAPRRGRLAYGWASSYCVRSRRSLSAGHSPFALHSPGAVRRPAPPLAHRGTRASSHVPRRQSAGGRKARLSRTARRIRCCVFLWICQTRCCICSTRGASSRPFSRWYRCDGASPISTRLFSRARECCRTSSRSHRVRPLILIHQFRCSRWSLSRDGERQHRQRIRSRVPDVPGSKSQGHCARSQRAGA